MALRYFSQLKKYVSTIIDGVPNPSEPANATVRNVQINAIKLVKCKVDHDVIVADGRR